MQFYDFDFDLDVRLERVGCTDQRVSDCAPNVIIKYLHDEDAIQRMVVSEEGLVASLFYVDNYKTEGDRKIAQWQHTVIFQEN